MPVENAAAARPLRPAWRYASCRRRAPPSSPPGPGPTARRAALVVLLLLGLSLAVLWFAGEWSALRRGTEVRDAKAWLYRVTHNAAVNALKRSGTPGASSWSPST